MADLTAADRLLVLDEKTRPEKIPAVKTAAIITIGMALVGKFGRLNFALIGTRLNPGMGDAVWGWVWV